MAYKGLQNNSPFSAELALLTDEDGRDVMLVLAKATYDISETGELTLSEEQEEVCFEGEYFAEPGQSSLKIAPEANFAKQATDVVLIGHAHAPYGQAVTQLDAGIKVGPVQQHVRVIGDRVWQKRVTGNVVNWFATSPQPFTQMPLVYERAFGGQDLTPGNEKHYAAEPRNLVGTGVIAKHSAYEEVALPNLEDPANLIKSPSDRPMPMGFGYISPDWQPRLGYAGTYDESWEKSRMPLLPKDFKREFFNSAHPKLTAPGFLQGNESVMLINVTPQEKLVFNLPNEKPEIKFKYNYEGPVPLNADLDTVLINTDEMQLSLLWRATQNVFNRIYDIEEVFVDQANVLIESTSNYQTATM